MLFSSSGLKYTHPGQSQLSFPDISLSEGESLLVLGKSGSGKTTFLNLLAGLLTPQSGNVILGKTDILKLTGAQLDLFRGKNIGLVFQKPHLLPPLTVKENLQVAQYFAKEHSQEIDFILKQLGVEHKANASVQGLSEGESQRVSIARALVNRPQVILADEPTSSLDDENAAKVIRLLEDQAKKIGAALIIVTHDQRVKDHIANFIEVRSS